MKYEPNKLSVILSQLISLPRMHCTSTPYTLLSLIQHTAQEHPGPPPVRGPVQYFKATDQAKMHQVYKLSNLSSKAGVQEVLWKHHISCIH